MTRPPAGDPLAAIDLEVLEHQLHASGIDLAGPLTAEVITGGRSNLTFQVSDGVTPWVVRRPPTAGLTPSAHDVGREYAVVQALQDTDVPVARTVLCCLDPAVMGAPFTIVEYVPGSVLRTRRDVDALDDDRIEAANAELIDVLARLHEVDYRSVGLESFGRPDGYVTRQVARWAQQWALVATRELPDLNRLHAALQERVRRLPPNPRASIVHGDYRIDNTLLDPRGLEIRAIVDWELATIGDSLSDLAMLCVYQHPAFDNVVGEPAASTSPKWPDQRRITDDYAAASGADLTDFDFYLALGYFKLAVISEGVYSRFLAGAGVGIGYATAGKAVPDLVAQGLRVLGVAI